MQLSFFGATQTVTGSRYLLRCADHRLLVDCGLFQGYKHLRLKNWAALPFDPKDIDAVLLTHAHLDHSGYLPVLIKKGFKGRIHATPATIELCRILLPDSGRLQEEQAAFANRHGFSKHSPALPLYTEQDARACLEKLVPVRFDAIVELAPRIHVQFRRSGHLFGAASVRVASERSSILFSGDVGRPTDVLMREPSAPCAADYIVVESTYGDRLHPRIDLNAEVGSAIRRATDRGGVVLIPTFAVGRAQTLLLTIARLRAAGRIPDVPVYLDSPMAIDATELLERLWSEHRVAESELESMRRLARLVHTAEESKALDRLREPAIILAASGMATGGRVVHHLKRFAPVARNLILFSGFQAGGTRGASLAAGAQTIRIHGETVPVRAEVVQLAAASGHADAKELLDWLRAAPSKPRGVFVTHGEALASDALRQRIELELGWNVTVPEYRDTVELVHSD
jgi:metallo-beta-lactamase family protein